MLLKWVVRIGGLLAFVLGIMISRSPVLNLHMYIGDVTALALALLAAWALAKGAKIPMAVIGLIWAGAIYYVGIGQMRWMTGGSHWIIEVLHGALGLGAIGLGDILGSAIQKRLSLR